MVNSPADKLLDCATLIQTQLGKSQSSATGFFFDFHIKGQRVPVLVSNRHVLESFDTLTFRLRISRESDFEKQLNSYSRMVVNAMASEITVILHPQDDIDLAIIPLGDLMHQLHASSEYVANYFIPETALLLKEDENSLSAIEDLIMTGCPCGLYDDFNHLPIIRSGITASHPAYSFQGKPNFLTDMSSFKGSSGSPVFLYNPAGYIDYQKNTQIFGQSRIKLLGIQHESYFLNQTQAVNLGVAHKAYLLLDFKPILSSMMNL